MREDFGLFSPNVAAGCLAVLGSVATAPLLGQRATYDGRIRRSAMSWLSVAAVVGLWIALCATGSRGGVLAFLAGAGWCLIQGKRLGGWRWVATAHGAGLLAGSAIFPEIWMRYAGISGELGTGSAGTRLTLWRASAAFAAAQPWTGFNDAFEFWYKALWQPETALHRRFHWSINDVLHLASHHGIVAMAGYVAVMVWAARASMQLATATRWAGWQANTGAILAAATMGATSCFINFPSGAWSVYVCIGGALVGVMWTGTTRAWSWRMPVLAVLGVCSAVWALGAWAERTHGVRVADPVVATLAPTGLPERGTIVILADSVDERWERIRYLAAPLCRAGWRVIEGQAGAEPADIVIVWGWHAGVRLADVARPRRGYVLLGVASEVVTHLSDRPSLVLLGEHEGGPAGLERIDGMRSWAAQHPGSVVEVVPYGRIWPKRAEELIPRILSWMEGIP